MTERSLKPARDSYALPTDSSDTEPFGASPTYNNPGAYSPLADAVPPPPAAAERPLTAAELPADAETLERVYRQVRSLRTQLAASRSNAHLRPLLGKRSAEADAGGSGGGGGGGGGESETDDAASNDSTSSALRVGSIKANDLAEEDFEG